MSLVKNLYLRLGLQFAPPGTGLHYVHQAVWSTYTRALARVPRAEPSIPNEVTVAFRISGGIGDHLIAARYIRDLLATTGDFKFDVYSPRPETAAWIFSSFKQCNACRLDARNWKRVYRKYPLAMWIMSFVVAYSWSAKWAVVRKHNRKLIDVCAALEKFMPKITLFIQHHPNLDGSLGQNAVYMNMNRYTFLQGMSGIPCGDLELDLDTDAGALPRFGLAGKQYVTVHNGFDNLEGKHVGENRIATKCYPRFGEVVTRLRAMFPEVCFVQLGTKTSTPIPEVDVDLTGATSMRETAEILRHARLHLDNESGLVHLAACLGVESCVVFGPTSVEYFAYERNINIRPTFCGGCWWTTGDWLKNCPRGFENAKCMTEQPPGAIAAAVKERLAAKLRPAHEAPTRRAG